MNPLRVMTLSTKRIKYISSGAVLGFSIIPMIYTIICLHNGWFEIVMTSPNGLRYSSLDKDWSHTDNILSTYFLYMSVPVY